MRRPRRVNVVSRDDVTRRRRRPRERRRTPVAMASSSSSGDLFMLTARTNGRAQPGVLLPWRWTGVPKSDNALHTVDDDEEVELASRPVPHSRPGRPKRPRDDLAQTLNSPSPDFDARKHIAPRRSGGAEPAFAPVPASPEDVDAWVRSCVPALVVLAASRA